MGGEALNIDPKRVVHETVDDETIIIDLDTGTYFSLAGSGPEVWGMIATGATVEQIGSELDRRYPEALPSARLPRLIERLLGEGLVTRGAAMNGTPPPAAWGREAANGSFVEPELTKFTDLQELLLLDPVHEIDEAGWPHAPPS